MYTAESVADWLLAYAENVNIVLTRKSLQKLLYFAQAHSLLERDEPIFEEEIEAWVHGPVVKSVWSKTKQSSRDDDYSVNLTEPFDFDSFREEDNYFLGKVWATYGKLNAQYLENKTHKELPWILNWHKEENAGEVISKELIKGYYLLRQDDEVEAHV